MAVTTRTSSSIACQQRQRAAKADPFQQGRADEKAGALEGVLGTGERRHPSEQA